jgi:hypothetical protein
MQHLEPHARLKAIEIANAILARDPSDEGRAIRIGIAQAKAWAARRRVLPRMNEGAGRIERLQPGPYCSSRR